MLNVIPSSAALYLTVWKKVLCSECTLRLESLTILSKPRNDLIEWNVVSYHVEESLVFWMHFLGVKRLRWLFDSRVKRLGPRAQIHRHDIESETKNKTSNESIARNGKENVLAMYVAELESRFGLEDCLALNCTQNTSCYREVLLLLLFHENDTHIWELKRFLMS